MHHMFTKLATVSFVALISLSPPQNPQDEVAALRRELQALREQQAQMQKELQAIKNFLQSLIQPRAEAGNEIPGLVGAAVPTAGEPVLGSPGARVTIMEVSDYHCPFCRRHSQQTFPQLQSEYISTGKVRYHFVDYPIAQLHPQAHRAHEAAACAAEQGKFWEMHASLFKLPPTRSDSDLTAQAKAIGLDLGSFGTCLSTGRHAGAIKESVARMEQLGINGTPMTLIGLTPGPGEPMKVVKYVYGAQPFSAFKEIIEPLLK